LQLLMLLLQLLMLLLQLLQLLFSGICCCCNCY
jgi:hypothetical protein